jgi:hypothetical protein
VTDKLTRICFAFIALVILAAFVAMTLAAAEVWP